MRLLRSDLCLAETVIRIIRGILLMCGSRFGFHELTYLNMLEIGCYSSLSSDADGINYSAILNASDFE